MGGLTGCLPLLAQFPILIGFYNMLTVAVELRGAPFFGWIQDLSLKDPYYITPILMGVTMFVQQKMAMSKIKDPQQLQQQRMMLFMPIMFTVICVQMPSGLVLYWFVNNLLGIGQQWLVNRQRAAWRSPRPNRRRRPRLESWIGPIESSRARIWKRPCTRRPRRWASPSPTWTTRSWSRAGGDCSAWAPGPCAFA